MYFVGLYLFVGLILSLVYTFLAGGFVDNDFATFFVTILISPAVFVGFSFVSILMYKNTSLVFKTMLVLICLPIVCNILSIIFSWFEWGMISEFLFTYRYKSLVLFGVFFGIFAFGSNYVKRLIFHKTEKV